MGQINISVVVCTYNRKHILQDCLQALFTQSYPSNKYEVLVIDDGSTDTTSSFLRNLAGKRKHFSFFRQSHAGMAKGRNLGLAHAEGNIIAFTDDDCLPAKDWLREIEQSFERNPHAIGVEGKTITIDSEITLQGKRTKLATLHIKRKSFRKLVVSMKRLSFLMAKTLISL